MAVIMNIRKSMFFLKDFSTGSGVKDHLDELVDKHQRGTNEILEKLLYHARATTDFYRDLNIEISLDKFPIVNKMDIKQNVNKFISKKYKKESLISVTTSGSTGTPFTVYQDKNKKSRNTADTMYYAKMAGYEIGQKLYYLKIWSQANHKGTITKYFQNIETVDVLNLSDKVVGELILRWTNETKSFGIIGYASALETICKYLERNYDAPIKTKVNSIIAISETLSDNVKERLTYFLGVQTLSRYSNVENGILAQQIGSESRFLLNSASYIFEIVDMSTDDILGLDRLGRIVITDLYNYGMPMIRYDSGDVGMITMENGQYYLKELSGRKLDQIFNTEGEPINALLVYKNMWKYKEIDQYQLIQKDLSKFVIRVVCPSGFNRHEQIIMEYRAYLGKEADITVEISEDIPLLASGKRRKVVNEMLK
jgi:phenylacetate-CoA ligase